MFSVMMMPMSPTSPMAMARPASDMMLRIDAQQIHEDEAHRHATAASVTSTDERAAQVQQENDDDQAADDGFLGERLLQRVDRLVDDVGAVVERHDVDLRHAAVGERLLGRPGSICLIFSLTRSTTCSGFSP